MGLAFSIDFVDVMSDVTCSWGPRPASENRSVQRYQINISIVSVTELLLGLDQLAVHWKSKGIVFLYLYLTLAVASAHDQVGE